MGSGCRFYIEYVLRILSQEASLYRHDSFYLDFFLDCRVCAICGNLQDTRFVAYPRVFMSFSRLVWVREAAVVVAKYGIGHGETGEEGYEEAG